MSNTPKNDDQLASDLEVLERRAVSLARVNDEDEVFEGRSLLLFRIADEWYAVDAGDVREIFQDYMVMPVPCVPAFILGVVNVRGEILSVTDPATMMGLGAVTGDGVTIPPAVVIANAEVVTAMIVDEIGDIVEVAKGAVEPPVSIIDRAQAEFVAGSVFVNDRMVGLLNIARVLEPIGA